MLTTFPRIRRLGLFYFCRTYLLRSLYHDLRVLSSQSLSNTSMSSSSPETPSGFQSPSAPTPIALTPRAHTLDLSDAEGSDAGLPAPSTAARRKGAPIWQAKSGHDALVALSATTAQLHSEKDIQLSLARTAFALCFSESCTLFLMVMSQVAHLFTPR